MDSRLRTLLILAGGILLFFYFSRGNNLPPPVRREVPAPPTEAQRGPAERFELRSGPLVATFSTHSGAVASWRLDADQFRDTARGDGVSTTDREPFYPLRTNIAFERNGQNVLPYYLTYRVERRDANTAELVARPEGTQLEIRRSIRPHTDYSFRVRTTVHNLGAPGRLRASQGVYHYVLRSQEEGRMFSPSWQRSEGLCRRFGSTVHRPGEDLTKLGDDTDGFASNADWVGLANTYFLTGIVPVGEPAACHLRAEPRGEGDAAGALYVGQLAWAPVTLATHEEHSYQVLSFLGPKLEPSLAAVTPSLRDATDLGTFAVIAKGLLWLLRKLHSFTHNWGVAIMLLTLLVRTALYPLLASSTRSMAMMQKLKPELDELNERFADDPNARGLATMELYRRNGVNPVSGCLPQFAQLPVWWALYTTLQTSVELYHAPFALWIKDLSARDPIFVLPLLLGGIFYVQQKLMPPSMPDPMQQKMMLYFMPIFLTVISLFLPAGLALYMLVNSLLAILQQRITKAQIDRMLAAQEGGISVRPVAEPALSAGKKGGSRG